MYKTLKVNYVKYYFWNNFSYIHYDCKLCLDLCYFHLAALKSTELIFNSN